MKKNVFILINLILCTLLDGFAQKMPAQIIYLKSGKVSLAENQLPEASQLESSLVNGKYYLMIQLKETITSLTSDKLTELGVEFFDYIPNKAYLVSVPQTTSLNDLLTAGVRSISVIAPEWKTAEELKSYTGIVPPPAGTHIRITLSWFKNVSVEIAKADLNEFGATVISVSPYFNRMLVDIDVINIKPLIQEAWVLWAEPEGPEMMETNLPGKTLTRSSTIGSSAPGARNLNGQGVIVGIWDGGTCGVHVDFTGHETNIETSTLSQHATHVTGTIGGAGLKDPDMTGMAPKATLLNWDFNGDIPGEMGVALSQQSIVITNNSYAYSTDPCATRGTYDQRSQDLDVLVNNNTFFTHVFAAGNFQTDNCAGSGASAGYRTVHSGSQASKNAIAVGAVDRYDAMSSFSAWGPIRDNRLKPEVVAVGVAVNSTNDPNVYASNQGTSMATPNVTGIVAQIYQRFRQLNSNQNPEAALIRAVMANTAEDLGNVGPDFKYGFGRVNALRAVRTLEDVRYYSDTIRPGSSGRNKAILVPANCKRMKVMITWNDPAGSTTASTALVNDLDLNVYDKNGLGYAPWVLSVSPYSAVATRGRDSLNNIEQVTIDNPSAGAWFVKVTGAVNFGNSQKFFITYEFDSSSLDVTYPNGGEVLVPGATEYLRWDAKFITGNVQLQYSADAGNSWTTISSSVPANSLYYTWTVPGIFTSKALIRVRTTDSSISSISDTTFNILGTPGGLTTKVCSNQIYLSWGAVTGAIAYEPMLMVNGDYVSKGITGTANRNFTFTGLTNGTEYWVTVRAIISADSAKGKRAIAVNATPTSANVATAFNTNLPLISSVCQNGNIVLRTQTTGAATLTRQWQRSINNGASWTTTGSNLDTLPLTNVTAASDKYLYRMNLTSSTCGNTITSVITTLRVDTGLSIIRVPAPVMACHNALVQFTYGSTSKSLPNTKWQYSPNNGLNWFGLGSPVFDSSITFNAPDTMNNYLIRAIASNGCDAGDTTASALLSVKQRLQVSLSNDTFICFRNFATLSAVAESGSPITYVWDNLGNNPSYQVQPSTTIYYRVNVSDSCGASFTDSILVAVMAIDSSWTHNSSGQTLINFSAAEPAATSYQWDFGDGANTNTKAATHFYSANGNYTVCLTVAKGGCSTAKCQQISVTKTGTGPQIKSDQLIQVYPNPASSEINITSSVKVKQVDITNELGQVILSVMANNAQNISIPLNTFDDGIYIIKISGDAGVVHKKVVVLK